MLEIGLDSPKNSADSTAVFGTLLSPPTRYCAEIWQRLSHIGTHRQEVIPPSEIGCDPVGIICPKRTAVVVDTGSVNGEKKSSIHANVIKFVREKFMWRENASVPEVTRKVIAGQSPKTFSQTEKVAIQALDSGNGLLQLVSSNAERARQIKPKQTVIEQLLMEEERCRRLDQPFMLGDRYEVMGLAHITGDMLADIHGEGEHRAYLLTAADLQNNRQTKTVPLTQAGLVFSDHFLNVAQIEEANELLTEHLRVRDEVSAPASDEITDPNIISHAGVGRNAALITYREVLMRIKEGLPETALNDTLEEVIAQARRDRGPKFLSSELQLEEVRLALRKAIGKRDQAVLRLRLPTPLRRRDLTVDKKFTADPVPDLPRSMPSPDVQVGNNAASILSPSMEGRMEHDTIQEVHLDEVKEGDFEEIDPTSFATEAVQRSSADRERVLACVRAHLDHRQLPLFDALAQENIEAAAFCAVQAQRMLTPTELPGQRAGDKQSMHAGVDVNDPKQGAVNRSLHELIACSRTEEPISPSGELPDSLMFGNLLLADLEHATERKQENRDISQINSSTLFPMGLEAALMHGRATSGSDAASVLPKLSPEGLIDLLAMHPDRSMLNWVEGLAPNNPQAAVLMHFLENAMRIRSLPGVIQRERYQYVAEEDIYKVDLQTCEGVSFFPTFLADVERVFDLSDAVNGEWQARTPSGIQPLHTKAEVVAYVLTNALQQLTNPDAQGEVIHPYPLTVYRLLSGMTDGYQVPKCFIDHEQRLVRAVDENVIEIIRRMADSRKKFRDREDAQLESKRLYAEEQKKQCLDFGVSNSDQLNLVINGFSPQVVAESVDVRIALTGEEKNRRSPRWIRSQLELSHDKQCVDNRGLVDTRRVDKRAWLRSAWLSVFNSVASPEDLAERFSTVNHESRTSLRHKKQRLEAVARLYFDNPRAFMQAVSPYDWDFDKNENTVEPWRRNLQIGANLGPVGPLDYLLRDRLAADGTRKNEDATIEYFLENILITIAPTFRSIDPNIMPLLVKLRSHYLQVDSTLPVVLHRGLGLPVMVVEQGTREVLTDDGEWVADYVNDLRVAAPVGSEIAHLVKPDQDDPSIDPSALVEILLDKFSDKPVIWLEHGTYSLYLPKRLTRAPHERDVVPAFDALEDVERSPIANSRSDDPHLQIDSASPKAGWVGSARNMWHHFSGGSP